MNKELKENTGYLNKLFNFLDSRLIIDKSIDFALIFIGLLAALSFENYVENKKIEFLQRSISEWENFVKSDTIMEIIVSEEYPMESWLKNIYPKNL